MALIGDDDWLEPTYVSRCSEVLLANSDLTVVCGTPRMFVGHQFVHQGAKMNILHPSRAIRVAAYFWRVGENVAVHGLMRRETVAGLPGIPEVLAGDWLFVAELAFLGKIRTLADTAVNLSLTGTSGSWDKVVSHERVPPLQARIPYLVIVWSAFCHVAWQSPVYVRSGRVGRLGTAVLASTALLAKFALWSIAVLAKRLWYRLTTLPFPLHARWWISR